MINSFQSSMDNIDKNMQSIIWVTDNGQELHGVLHRKEDRLILNVNTKDLTEEITFNYLYHDSRMGGRRVLYPYDLQSAKTIPFDKFYESWQVEVHLLVDEHNIPELGFENQVSFTYESFLWNRVPENDEETKEHDKLLSRLSKINTSVGEVTITLLGSDRRSNYPSLSEKRMDEITIILDSKSKLSNSEILMWNTRFTQLMTLIHRERVVLNGIEMGINNMLVPSLMEQYSEASYAYREPIWLQDFVEFMELALPQFIDEYEHISGLFEDLVQYYRDYPLDPPDNIQLLRLFSGLEQCANHLDSTKSNTERVLSVEEKTRDADFENMLTIVRAESSITPSLKKYLKKTSKKYYVSPEDPASTKVKIIALAEFISSEYEIFNYLRSIENVKTIWSMRNVVAHGFVDEIATTAFYSRRDDFGQDIEQTIRIYLFYLLGVSKELIVKHKDPLKARQFNAL